MMKNILISSIVFIAGVIVLFNYVPLSIIDIRPDNLGTIANTELQSVNLLTEFPTFYNAQYALLNNGKVDVSSTTWDQLTTANGLTTANSLTSATALATIGTIGTGVWQGTTVDELFGGTGFATYTAGDLIYSSASNVLSKLGVGSNDQILTLVAGFPAWASGSVDETLSYNFTGSTFRIKNLNASSTPANPLVLNGLSYSFPSASQPTSTTTLRVDSSGNVTATAPRATSTVFTASGVWTKPAHLNYVRVRVLGGGGGTGGTDGDSGDGQNATGGGGAGAYAEGWVSVSGNVTVTVGAGGTAGASGAPATAGGTGGTSSFVADVTVSSAGGDGSGGDSLSAGAGGTATGGDLNINGGTGKAGGQIGLSWVGGHGADSPFGNGGLIRFYADGNGFSPSGYGAGAGGAKGISNQGAAGSPGFVIVEWYE